MTWYASVDGGRSAFSVRAETRAAAKLKAQGLILSPNVDTHPGFFFETRDNPTQAHAQVRALILYTPQEWNDKEHHLRRTEGVVFPGDTE